MNYSNTVNNSSMAYEHSYGDHLGRPLRRIFSSSGEFSELYLCLTIFAAFVLMTFILFILFLSISYLTRKSCGISLDVENGANDKHRFDTIIPPITLS